MGRKIWAWSWRVTDEERRALREAAAAVVEARRRLRGACNDGSSRRLEREMARAALRAAQDTYARVRAEAWEAPCGDRWSRL